MGRAMTEQPSIYSRPEHPFPGTPWIDTETGLMMIWTGEEWVGSGLDQPTTQEES
jgi:hypothetical protein